MDLFLTKREQLRQWAKTRGIFRTSEIIDWGRRNYYNSADREKRRLRSQEIIRPLNRIEKKKLNYKSKEEIYIYCGG